MGEPPWLRAAYWIRPNPRRKRPRRNSLRENLRHRQCHCPLSTLKKRTNFVDFVAIPRAAILFYPWTCLGCLHCCALDFVRWRHCDSSLKFFRTVVVPYSVFKHSHHVFKCFFHAFSTVYEYKLTTNWMECDIFALQYVFCSLWAVRFSYFLFSWYNGNANNLRYYCCIHNLRSDVQPNAARDTELRRKVHAGCMFDGLNGRDVMRSGAVSHVSLQTFASHRLDLNTLTSIIVDGSCTSEEVSLALTVTWFFLVKYPFSFPDPNESFWRKRSINL